MPRGDILLPISEERLQDVDEISRLGDVEIERQLSVLIEECVCRGLDDNVF